MLQITSNRNIRKGYFDTADGQIHYAVAGKGPALLCIHQSSSSLEEYASLVPYLADAYQLVLFDLPGHGMSDDPIEEPGVEEFTDVAIALIDYLDIKTCSVLGHHGGALMSMNLAYRYPERIDKVILSGTSGIKTAEESEAFKENLASKKKVILDKDGQSLVLAWQRFVTYMPGTSVDEILRPYLNSVLSRMRPFDAHDAVLKWDRKQALASLGMPVLFIQGKLDGFVSKQENLLDLLPNAERKVIETGGAFLFFDRAKECAQIIADFLSKS